MTSSNKQTDKSVAPVVPTTAKPQAQNLNETATVAEKAVSSQQPSVEEIAPGVFKHVSFVNGERIEMTIEDGNERWR